VLDTIAAVAANSLAVAAPVSEVRSVKSFWWRV